MIEKNLTRIEEGILAFLLVGMTLLVFVEVVLRFGFNTGIHWAQEVTLHLSAWFVLFGASYGVKVGAHIGVDAVVRLLPPQTKRIVSMFAVLLCLTYCALIIMGAWVYLAKVYEIGIGLDDTRIPMWLVNTMTEETAWDFWRIDTEDPVLPTWIAHSIILLGFVLLFIRFVEVGWNFATGKADSFHFADEAEEALEELAKEQKKQVLEPTGPETGDQDAQSKNGGTQS